MTIEELLLRAVDLGASDIHITVGVPPKLRINGELRNLEDYPRMMPTDTDEILSPIMSERERAILDQKGEVDFSYSLERVARYRVNIFKQRGSLAAVLRIVSTKIPKPEDLGIPTSVVDLYTRKKGMVLVTGPTGSGKSTTLAALVDKINCNTNAHIITLEDPIEYTHRHQKSIVNQREIGLDSSSYAGALRAALREDPDVILVGEMRDLETISTAITAAETGHLVLSTLHTIGAANTIDRIIDVFPSEQQAQIRVQLGSVLEAVISQQLLPTADLRGRVAAFEVMHANMAIRNLIREGKTHQIGSMILTNKKIGMCTMDDSLEKLYMEGTITREKALMYAQDPIALERKLY